MVDLHCHILPCVDDGADSMETALEMARIAVESKVDVIITTPHSNMQKYFTHRLRESFERFSLLLDLYEIPLKLVPGMEIFATDNIVSLIKKNVVFPMGNSNYYLIEFPFRADENWIEKILLQMLDAGFCPIVAHPERYFCIQQKNETAHYWRQLGCQLQVNTGSVFGDFGLNSANAAKLLLKENQVDCVGSDAHDAFERVPCMTEFIEFLDKYISQQQKEAILNNVSQRILRYERY